MAMPMSKYTKATIVVPDKAMLDKLEAIQPGEKVLYGYEYHPVFSRDVVPSLSDRAHALITALEDAKRIMRFVVRQTDGRFGYVALGMTPRVHAMIVSETEKVELPSLLREITARYSKPRRG